MKSYYVAKIRPNSLCKNKAKEYYQAETVIDALSCDAVHPILKLQGKNKKEVIKEFKIRAANSFN